MGTFSTEEPLTLNTSILYIFTFPISNICHYLTFRLRYHTSNVLFRYLLYPTKKYFDANLGQYRFSAGIFFKNRFHTSYENVYWYRVDLSKYHLFDDVKFCLPLRLRCMDFSQNGASINTLLVSKPIFESSILSFHNLLFFKTLLI